MAVFAKRWNEPKSLFGDVMVIAFILVQFLDGVFTYLGVGIWGPAIEANPIIRSAMGAAGVGAGLGAAKVVAIAFGILLHLRRVHTVLAILTAIYLTIAVLPWTALFLMHQTH